MLEHWEDCSVRRKRSKEKMIHYCVEVWGNMEIGKFQYWPAFGTFEVKLCQALLDHLYEEEEWDNEELDYARLWEYASARLFPIKTSGSQVSSGKTWEPLENLPPPYQVPPTQALAPAVPPSAPSAQSAPPPNTQVSDAGAPGPSQPPPPLSTQPGKTHTCACHTGKSTSPPASRTRQKTRKEYTGDSDDEKDRPNLYPLREVPTAPGIIGFVNIPINTGDVRAFKKEMRKLMDDPLGVAERLDEFLGNSIYSYDDISAILRSLFNAEERDMIRQAAIKDWEFRNPQGGSGAEKWPEQRPSWNAQVEADREEMIRLRNMVIQGIRGAVPRGQNISKALGECQGKDETPTDWLERLRKSLQMYSGTDPDSPVGTVLLKTQFVAKSWEDIRKKLEKIDNWQEKSLQELLREAQKVYMRRDEEKQKTQARVLVAAVREAQTAAESSAPARGPPGKPAHTQKKNKQVSAPECFYCKKKGHLKRDCKKRIKDEKVFQEE
uniref:CCHC-type domain-containing protein n=1 Tax=Taeniopygia guttata TaxID=59729 RepID=A0A674GP49_TAEGU